MRRGARGVEAPSLGLRSSVAALPQQAAEHEADAAAEAVLRSAPADLSRIPALRPPARSTPGQGLDAETLAFFEAGFGHDFSHVTIHDGASAGESANRIGAEAYTYGEHIRFAPGRYRPHDAAGRALLAHELAHVVQQNPAGRLPASSRSRAPALTPVSGPALQAKLVASGDSAGFAAFANSVIAVQKEVVVSGTGEVSIRSTAVQGPMTPEAAELVRVIELVIADRALTTVEFIHGQTSRRASDASVLGGNYALSRTDLDDLSALGTQGSVGVGQGRTGGTVLAHEILEQYRKQVHGEGFPVAHAAAVAAEETAIGATRGPERFRQVNATTLEVTIPYTYPGGRVVEVTWDIVNGNYQNVRRRVLPAGGP